MNEKKLKITLEEKETLIFEIEDKKGIKTGEILEFDLDDIELPIKYYNLVEEDKKNKKWYRDELLIINKRQDVKVKGDIASKNEIDRLKAAEKFFKKEVEIYNGFLGENGVQKLLNGAKVGWESLKVIDKMLEEQVLPYLDLSLKSLTDKVTEKYGQAVEKSKKIMEIE